MGSLAEASLRRSYLSFAGCAILSLSRTVYRLGAFGLITLGVTVTKFNSAPKVIYPLLCQQVYRAGVGLLPMVSFLSLALGLVIIGQTVALLTRVGAHDLVGTVMVTVVIRELGPLTVALVVLARVGTATVIELGNARALGEIEALEALGIDPIHYLVIPRVLGLALSICALTVYFILGAVGSGYLFAFLQDVPLQPGEYFRQLARALQWQDFVLLALKGAAFGSVIATVTCYQGLARPLRLEEVSAAATRAVVQSVVVCVLIDAAFIVIYLLM